MPTERKLLASAAATVLFVIVEGAIGVASGSLALVSDAGHNLSDAAALALSWYAARVVKRPATAQRTFGYRMAGILAAMVNAASLVAVAGFIVWEAIERFRLPRAVSGGAMILMGAAGVAVNLSIVVAGLLVRFARAPLADPLISVLIAALILWSSWSILKESVDVLLEASPSGIEMTAVERAIASVPGVLRSHDLHVWTIGSGVIACSCHIVVAEQSVRSEQQVLDAVAEELDRRFHINHSTLQVEVEGCDPNDMYCVLKALKEHPQDHV